MLRKNNLKDKVAPPSCDWTRKPDKGKKPLSENRTRLFKYKGSFSWQAIRTERYKAAGTDWADIIRKTLIGSRGESSKFHVRYFEIAPEGFSSLEKHRHEHVVIAIRGKGIGIAGKKKYEIGFLDTLYIKPNEPHQFRNPYREPFGFLCIVNAKRDRPKILG